MWGTYEVISAPPKIGKPPTDCEGVVEFVRKRLQFEADERQTEVLMSGAKRGILNCTRQWGKSTVGAAMAVHRAFTRKGCTVLVASPSGRQSGELVMKAEAMLGTMGISVQGDGNNERSLELPNGSRIVGLPENPEKIRGFSAVSLLLIDEAAQVEEAMYLALRPMLAVSNGDLWLMSTPYGKQGFFYERWVHGGPGWQLSVKATECRRGLGRSIWRSSWITDRRCSGGIWWMRHLTTMWSRCGSKEEGRLPIGRRLPICPTTSVTVLPS
jgi:hypothetical protein